MSGLERQPNRGWFKKGQSGNPGGRPTKAQAGTDSAFNVIVDRTLTVSRGGVAREVTIEEALQHHTYKEALAGKRMAIREVMRWITKREQWLAEHKPRRVQKVTFAGTIEDPNNADDALLLLGIVRENTERKGLKVDRLQLLQESWAVKAALKRRRGTRSLTTKEIDDVRRCTHDDGTLRLPIGVDQ